MFTDEILIRGEEIVSDVCADFGGELREFNGEADHAHLLVHYPPQVSLSRLVNSLKGVSSRHLRREFSDQGGNPKVMFGVGPDNVGGTADDIDVVQRGRAQPVRGLHRDRGHPQPHRLGLHPRQRLTRGLISARSSVAARHPGSGGIT